MSTSRTQKLKDAIPEAPPANGEATPGQKALMKKPDPAGDLLTSMEEEFRKCLPEVLPWDMFARVALTGFRKTPELVECTRPSLLGALMECARLGLAPCTEEASLVPFNNRQKQVKECQLIVGYQGYVQLMYRSGQVEQVVVELVHEADKWEYTLGDGGRFWHEPKITATRADRGAPIFAYSFATLLTGGRTRVATVNLEEAEELKRKYGTKSTSSWRTNFEAMWLKGLALDTPIPTLAGWTTMGQLGVGDTVLDREGKPAQVRAVSTVKQLPCYRLTLRNGHSIVCDDEHLWVARVGQQKEKVHSIASLHEAKRQGASITVPVAAPLDLPPASLPVDPWVLGYWLGNGELGAPRVTTSQRDLNDVLTAVAASGYQVGAVRHDPRNEAVRVGIRGLGKDLADLGVLGSKHVPPAYLRGSIEQRRALLTGLMDSDGSVWDRTKRVYFSSTSRELRDAVTELARSLGEQVLETEWQATGYGQTVTALAASWTPTVVPFSVRWKAERSRPRLVRGWHGVKSIERVETVPTCCISVDSPSQTYLAGVDMVPTHNTPVRRIQKFAPKSAELRRAYAVDGATLDLGGITSAPNEDGVLDGEVVETAPEKAEPEQPQQQPDPDAWEGMDVAQPPDGEQQ